MTRKKVKGSPSQIPKKQNIFAFGVILFGTSILSFILGQNFNQDQNSTLETRQKGFQFISPLIDCAENTNSNYNFFIFRLKRKIENILEEYPTITTSIFFRDLTNGPILSINPNEKFSPASLTKIPIMMSYFKYAEDFPEILYKSLIFKNSIKQDNEVFYTPKDKLQIGRAYRIEELIKRMIIYSDNSARRLLIQDVFNNTGKNELAVPIDFYSNIFNDLLLSSPDSSDAEMTTKEVASFFRVLYNASYLNRKYSEKALSILTKVTFSEGIRKNLPQNIVIANKFGEDQIGKTRFLHDCGIIYYPNKPYLLCVMTKGNNNQKQADVISIISKVVFTLIKKIN